MYVYCILHLFAGQQCMFPALYIGILVSFDHKTIQIYMLYVVDDSDEAAFAEETFSKHHHVANVREHDRTGGFCFHPTMDSLIISSLSMILLYYCICFLYFSTDVPYNTNGSIIRMFCKSRITFDCELFIHLCCICIEFEAFQFRLLSYRNYYDSI